MVAIIEPVGAGLLVAAINKFILNNPDLWAYICGCGKPHHDESHEDASSSTTTVNEAELVHVHHFDPWMHT